MTKTELRTAICISVAKARGEKVCEGCGITMVSDERIAQDLCYDCREDAARQDDFMKYAKKLKESASE